MNILFTAGGRRVELIEIFQQEFKDNQIFVADIINSAPALYLGEERFVIPKMSDSDALERILEICQDKNINAIIPLIDPELEFYAQNIDEFLKRNIRIVISESTTVMMTRNKWETYEFFRRNDIPTPTTYLNIEKVKDFPVISKPIKGSASRNVQIIYNPSQLNFYSKYYSESIYQRFIEGEEITVDVIGDGRGKLLAECQRKRLKVRAGEVERAITMFDKEIHKFIEKIVALIKPFGLINIQVFKDIDQNIFFTEINMRLGGGSPLTYKAGINIPRIMRDILTGDCLIHQTIFARENVCMLRFDRAFYMEKEELITE